MARKAFYSFHYVPDCHRAAQVRQIGAVEGNVPAEDNDWESVTKQGEKAIENWIASQMKGRDCTVVLIGNETAGRKWITHEIIESWNKGIGVVGIRIHGLKNLNGMTSLIGQNPFDYINYRDTQHRLSSIIKCYDPGGADSKERYAWIAKYLPDAIEEAIKIRAAN